MKSKNNLNHGNRNTLAGLVVLPALLLIFSLSTAFVPRDNDLPDLNHHLNTFVPVSSGLSVVTSEPIRIIENTQPILIEDLDLEPLAELHITPDTNKVKYGSKIETDDGFVLLEFDENMNLQKITKDGKELKGEERNKYEKFAEKSKEAYNAEIEQSEKEKEIAKLEEQLKEVQKRMQEVQSEYNEILESYLEKSAIAGDYVWPEIYAESFNVARDAHWDVYQKLQESMPEVYDFPIPEIPEFDYDEELFQEQFERAQETYKDVWKDFEADQNEWKKQWKLQEELRSREWEAQALENESRRLETGLRSQMLNDGLIDHWDDMENFTLTEKKLEVNGKKQSEELHKKYLQLYKELTGKELEGKLQINQD